MSRLTTVSTVSMLGVMSALLAGCPVWGPEPRRDGGMPPTNCSRNSDCAADQYCNPGTNQCVTTPTCGAGGTCMAGYYCDGRNACVPGCSRDADCSALGTGLVCNTSTSRCEPSNQCSATRPCPSGQTCVDGACRAPSSVCQFNYQCAAGQECVDGRCLRTCFSSDGGSVCPTGSVCRDGYCQTPPPPSNPCDCAPNEVCANNVCLRACMGDAECGAGNFCDNGVCRVDDRRPPGCGAAGSCSPGSVCVDGACRITCPPANPTAMGCQTIDVNFNTCDTTVQPMPICRYSNEVAPQCARNADCGGTRVCVNALCRN